MRTLTLSSGWIFPCFIRRGLKDHKQLKQIAEHNPDNEDIFEDNLVDNFYPQRPQQLEDICLCDFVANYNWPGKDRQGRRTYKKLTKPKLPNHKLFDPENENQKGGILLLPSSAFLSIQR